MTYPVTYKERLFGSKTSLNLDTGLNTTASGTPLNFTVTHIPTNSKGATQDTRGSSY
jgi:hypothetical protein